MAKFEAASSAAPALAPAPTGERDKRKGANALHPEPRAQSKQSLIPTLASHRPPGKAGGGVGNDSSPSNRRMADKSASLSSSDLKAAGPSGEAAPKTRGSLKRSLSMLAMRCSRTRGCPDVGPAERRAQLAGLVADSASKQLGRLKQHLLMRSSLKRQRADRLSWSRLSLVGGSQESDSAANQEIERRRSLSSSMQCLAVATQIQQSLKQRASKTARKTCNNKEPPVALCDEATKASSASLGATGNGKSGADERLRSLANGFKSSLPSLRGTSGQQKQRKAALSIAAQTKKTSRTTMSQATDNKTKTNLAKFNKNQMAKSSCKNEKPRPGDPTAATSAANKSLVKATSVLADAKENSKSGETGRRQQATSKQAFWSLR